MVFNIRVQICLYYFYKQSWKTYASNVWKVIFTTNHCFQIIYSLITTTNVPPPVNVTNDVTKPEPIIKYRNVPKHVKFEFHYWTIKLWVQYKRVLWIIHDSATCRPTDKLTFVTINYGLINIWFVRRNY